MLKPGGALCLADVAAGSDVGRFLNIFIDRHADTGHSGSFLDETTPAQVRAAGLTIEREEKRSYYWVFPDVSAMTQFCGLLFGVDQLDPAILLQGIGDYLGYRAEAGQILLNWELYFIRAARPFL